MDVGIEPAWVEEAARSASLWSYLPKLEELQLLESKIDYKFSSRGLLLEAITHPSQMGAGYCYQRLEFLGDSVLDLLITRHLFKSHKDIGPGELTDLRAASVNNENFAGVSVRYNLHHHLQHGSGALLEQVTAYVESIKSHDVDLPRSSPKSSKVPKVSCHLLFTYHTYSSAPLSLSLSLSPLLSLLAGCLPVLQVLGDIVESIAGAILIDSNLDLDAVWKVFQSLLSPIVTPDNLELPPLRALTELCASRGYFVHTNYTKSSDDIVAELRVQLEGVLLVRQGRDTSKKAAKGRAAALL
ncbi:unnamed protein product [Spirodela intermedia]|uniref:RNase III domain-containing protein n=1 Tax=Spirodela intermedia TaxID=51605 RepID=A0A7I8ISX1_SPIIN|nr:unnamed protein product [Spirodela intermedia]CAA6660912.1 unnamed protein product [Spirodela intermedia]